MVGQRDPGRLKRREGMWGTVETHSGWENPTIFMRKGAESHEAGVVAIILRLL